MPYVKYAQAAATMDQMELLLNLGWQGDSESKLNRGEAGSIIDRLLKEKSEKRSEELLQFSATVGQLNLLSKLGWAGDATKLTFLDASAIIKSIRARNSMISKACAEGERIKKEEARLQCLVDRGLVRGAEIYVHNGDFRSAFLGNIADVFNNGGVCVSVSSIVGEECRRSPGSLTTLQFVSKAGSLWKLPKGVVLQNDDDFTKKKEAMLKRPHLLDRRI